MKHSIGNSKAGTSDVLNIKSVFCDQLRILAEKFENLSKDDITDYQEMKTKIADTVEEFCLSNEFVANELVCLFYNVQYKFCISKVILF